MALAALIALTLLASGPASEAPPTADAAPADSSAAATSDSMASDDQGIPPGVPTDDYRFVAWCYGAMDESIQVYQAVIPELKAIDARVGSPVKEEVPYAKDVAEERVALKRFAAAMEAAERASPHPIAPDGVAAMQLGRSIWSEAKTQPPRQLAHAWLMWGSPDRCETAAKTLKTRATLLGQAMAVDAPTVDAPSAPAAPKPALKPDSDLLRGPEKAPASIDSLLDSPSPASGPSAPSTP